MSILRKVDNNIWFVIHCPTCNQKHSVGVVTVAEAIERKSPIVCFACKGGFFIEVTCQTRDAQLRIGADDAEQKSPECNPNNHDWKKVYYGYKCQRCEMFVPFGSEPWAPIVE